MKKKKVDNQKSSVEVIDKDVHVENLKTKRFMETMGDLKHPKLERYSLSLFSLTLGPWLGDAFF